MNNFYKLNLNETNAFLGDDGYYHYLYKITNIINDDFYYGIHSTKNLYDNYIGSGKRLHYAYKKYGLNSFIKEILYYFKNELDMLQKEFEIVNEELILNNKCYNIAIGGGKSLYNQTIVKDKYGNILKVSLDDDRFINNELVGICKNTVTVKDKDNNTFRISTDLFNKNKDIYSGVCG